MRLMGLRSIIGRCNAWAMASTTHILIVALVLSVAGNYWQHTRTAKWQRIARSEEQGRANDRADYIAAQSKARAAQIAVNDAASARYSAIAKESDHEHHTALDGAQRLADSYIRLHRTPRCSPGGTNPAATGDGASVPAAMPAASVMVSPGDVQSCTALGAYAIAAHDWAVALDSDVR